MVIIFCDNVLDSQIVDEDYQEEMNVAKQNGFEILVISFEELTSGNLKKSLKNIPKQSINKQAIYRGWMLTVEQYSLFYKALLNKNIQLINTVLEYQHCHYLPSSHHKIKEDTPKSNWTTNLSEEEIIRLSDDFGDESIIVKDFVKSEKHNWEDACFITNASNKEHVQKVVLKFIELRGVFLNEGIVFRKFEELQFLTNHSKSGMPLTKEYRLFFLNKKLLAVFNYWDEGVYEEIAIDLNKFIKIAQTIESNFFTIDIAQKINGEWIIMELGDGQVSGLPNNADKEEFYKKIFKQLKL